MTTELEDRLRHYGETFESAIVTRDFVVTTAPTPVRRGRPRALPTALGALVAAALVIALVMMFVVTRHDTRRAPATHAPSIELATGFAIWPGPHANADVSTPAATARSFIEAMTHEEPSAVIQSSDVVARVTLRTGATIDVVCNRTDGSGGWSVLQARSGGAVSWLAQPSELRVTMRADVAARAKTLDVVWRDARGTHVEARQAFAIAPDRLGTVTTLAMPTTAPVPSVVLARASLGSAPSGGLDSAVVVVRDAAGDAIDVEAALYSAPPTVHPGVLVPDVNGQDVRSAKAFLQRLGLKVDTVPGVNGVSSGVVISQDPPPGSRVPWGSRVTLTTRSTGGFVPG